MNENPRMIVARGTSEANVSFRLKMSKQANTMKISATQTRTASSLATAEPTSYSCLSTKDSKTSALVMLLTLRLAVSSLRSL